MHLLSSTRIRINRRCRHYFLHLCFIAINVPLFLEVRDFMCFSQLKNIKFQTFKISGTLVFLCTSEQGLHLRTPNPGLTRGSPPPFVI
jgi:hypothetical protein